MNILTIERPNKTIIIDIEQLREYLDYRPTEGLLYWIKGRRKGLIAGSVKVNANGVCHRIGYNKIVYPTSHIIWILQTNTYPTLGIHYLDSNPINLKWDNLEQNLNNINKRKRKIAKNNTTGSKGVSKKGSSYVAYIAGKTIATDKDIEVVKNKRLIAEQLLDY